MYLHLVHSLFGFFSVNESSDSIDHVLDELFLRSSESSLVGDVEDAVVGLSVLSVDASDLDFVVGSDFVKGLLVSHELRELDVHGCSPGSSEVRGAGSDVTKMIVMGKLENSFNVGGGSAESLEDFGNLSSWLHRNDSELVLLVDPDEERFLCVVENTSARWPVSVQVACSKIFVALPVKKNIRNYVCTFKTELLT